MLPLRLLPETLSARATVVCGLSLAANLAALATATTWANTIAVLAAIGAAVLAAAFMILAMVRPITRLEQAMVRLSEGDHDAPVPATGRSDEIGNMARALEFFVLGMQENERLPAE